MNTTSISQKPSVLRKQEVLPIQYRIQTTRSLDEITSYLCTMKTPWGLRLWDTDLPQTYLLSCEDLTEVLACLSLHDVLSEIRFEQNLAALVMMAASHGMAYCQLVEAQGQQIQVFELSIQGIEVLTTLLGLKQGRLCPNEDSYRAYCRGVERLYQEVFVHAFHLAQQARREEKEPDPLKMIVGAYIDAYNASNSLREYVASRLGRRFGNIFDEVVNTRA